MARGITESDVHGAADELVRAGERPTVERIRAHLGTGSPNTVVRWLETWWQGLGKRLASDRQARIAAANVPDTVAELAGQWWTLAMDQAQIHAEDALAHERDALLQDRATLAAEREAIRIEVSQINARLETAEQARQLAAARAGELERLVEQLQRQHNELTLQRDGATSRAAEMEVARDAVLERLQQLQDATHVERETLAQHIRAAEDRAGVEIDRARQEAKAYKTELVALRKENDLRARTQREELERATLAATDLRQELAAQRARAETYQTELATLRNLTATLEAVWSKQQTLVRPKVSRPKATKPKASR